MPRVLVVDESPSVLHEVSKLLRECGYEVHTAHNTSVGLSLLGKHEFRLALVDYNPQAPNSFECLIFVQAMKADARFEHIPFIVWCKEDLGGNRLRGIAESGGRFLLKKPPYSRLPALVSQMIASVADTVG